jgi:gamma-glutamylaminecyclotransferase
LQNPQSYSDGKKSSTGTAVFIYGTLKKTFPLHDKGLGGARFLGVFETLKPYPLYIAMDFYGPVMLDRPGDGLVVRGELYDADEERLQLIDELEDIGDPGSFRSLITVRPVGGGEVRDAVVYMKDETWLHPLHNGPLAQYEDRRFIPPWER